MNNSIKLVILACLLFVYGKFHAQTSDYVEKLDTFSCSLFFSQGGYTLDLDLNNNAKMINRIDSILRYYPELNIIYFVDINAFASLDGLVDKNFELSEKRALSVKNYFLQIAPTLDQSYFHAKGLGENWEEFRNIVLLNDTIPARQQLINILNDNRLNDDEKKIKIKQLAKGTTYDYLKMNILPFLRKANVRLKFGYKEKVLQPQPEIIKEEEVVDTIIQQTIPESPPTPTVHHARWALKTNLVYWAAAGIANAGVEYAMGKQFSIDIPVTYSPYTVRNNWRMRSLSIQPEIRWWTNQTMKGHFFGFHGHLAYYNISTDNLDRYQDKDGKTPLWGFGLSYGYAFHLKKRWNMEITIGGGYARLNYDIFYNVNNGAMYEGGTKKDYWGITRAAVNLIYLFNE